MANWEAELLLGSHKELKQEPQFQLEILPGTTSKRSTAESSQGLPPACPDSSLVHFMDLLPIPIVLVDRNNTIRFINSATTTMNRDYHTVLGEDISRLFPRQSDHLGIKALLENMPSCGHAQIREGEIQVLSKTVNCRIFLSSTSVAGEQFTILVVEDCTILEKVSILSEECRKLVTVVPAGVAQFELSVPVSLKAPPAALNLSIMNARLTTANDEFACMHGFSGVDELRGAVASEFVQPLSRIESVFRHWMEKGMPLYQTKLSADDEKDYEIVLAANINKNQVISYWIVERSLEKSRQMKAQLRSVGGRFQTVFDSVADVILMKDLDSRYVEMNPAAQRLLGVDRDAIKGKSPEDVWGVETGRKIREFDVEALKGVTSEQICTAHAGGRVTVHLTSTPMRDLEGTIIGLFEIGRVVHNPWNASGNSDPDPANKKNGRFPACRSVAMRKTMDMAWVGAKTEGTVLLTGETGSGKDFLARLIHRSSARAAGPFITINCAALPMELAESELFGHEPGAFTGAKKQKKGMLELAHGGTLLMNEIGDLPFPLQAKLLTFLDTNSLRRVGGTKEISVDARILAATNRALSEDIANGLFRQDLFYRLNVLSIVVPPLRERREDLPELIRQILTDLAGRNGLQQLPQLSPSVMSALVGHDWPGNVRELKSVLQRVLILSEVGEVTTKSLGLEDTSTDWAIKIHFPKGQSLNEVLDDVKHALIEEALKRTGGRRRDAAHLLGISRSSLKHHMRVRAGRKYWATKSGAAADKEHVAEKETL